MTWAAPWLLLLVPALALVALGRWAWARSLRRRQAGVGAGLPAHTRSVHRGREVLRLVLLWTGLALGLVALAGPRWGAGETTRSARGADVIVLFDCSRSMLADDLHPTRLETARRKALDLLRVAPETRLALMPFAAVPVLRCPLTGDHEALREMLLDCSPDLFPAENGYQGTAIGRAVTEGLGVLNRQVERGQAVLIITDGADDDKDAVKAAATKAKEAGIPVCGLFVADPEKKVTLSINGKDEVMDSDRTTIDALATATGGLAVNATLDDADVQALADHLNHTVSTRPWEERQRVVASERYQWVLAAAIGIFFAGAGLGTRRAGPSAPRPGGLRPVWGFASGGPSARPGQAAPASGEVAP